MSVNKVVFGAVTIMDISDSTVTPETLGKGAIAYDKSGTKIVGTMEATTVGGGGTIETCTVNITQGDASNKANVCYLKNVNGIVTMVNEPTYNMTSLTCVRGSVVTFVSSRQICVSTEQSSGIVNKIMLNSYYAIAFHVGENATNETIKFLDTHYSGGTVD